MAADWLHALLAVLALLLPLLFAWLLVSLPELRKRCARLFGGR